MKFEFSKYSVRQ